jgi:hypothetical protein
MQPWIVFFVLFSFLTANASDRIFTCKSSYEAIGSSIKDVVTFSITENVSEKTFSGTLLDEQFKNNVKVAEFPQEFKDMSVQEWPDSTVYLGGGPFILILDSWKEGVKETTGTLKEYFPLPQPTQCALVE